MYDYKTNLQYSEQYCLDKEIQRISLLPLKEVLYDGYHYSPGPREWAAYDTICENRLYFNAFE